MPVGGQINEAISCMFYKNFDDKNIKGQLNWYFISNDRTVDLSSLGSDGNSRWLNEDFSLEVERLLLWPWSFPSAPQFSLPQQV